jgi:hypothetical protein
MLRPVPEPLLSIGDDDQGSDSGSAYVFERNGAQWSEDQKLMADDGLSGDTFGVAVDIDDDSSWLRVRP